MDLLLEIDFEFLQQVLTGTNKVNGHIHLGNIPRVNFKF